MDANDTKKIPAIEFPHFFMLKASAGSGKTRELTKRFVTFLIRENIHHNSLKNLLAITFSNNAAREMKERIIQWLKGLYFGKMDVLNEFQELCGSNSTELSRKAGILMDEILNRYSDFQIKTIDSFMVTVLRASALDFGYNPDFQIVMQRNLLFQKAFDIFLKKVFDGSESAEMLSGIIEDIEKSRRDDSGFLWNPSSEIFKVISNIYSEICATSKNFDLKYIEKLKDKKSRLEEKLRVHAEDIERRVKSYELDFNKRSSFPEIVNAFRNGYFTVIIDRSINSPPINKPKNKGQKINEQYNEIIELWNDLREMVSEYIELYSKTYFLPMIQVIRAFEDVLEEVKKEEEKIFIDDVNKKICENIDSGLIPEIYFKLGERIYHFFIDEFQDTSPIQWYNLFPLIENSLSQGGSLFVVGDTKQAIYRFRGADYKIMRRLEKEPVFPSVGRERHIIHELNINRRSNEKIIEFNKKVFKENIKQIPELMDAAIQSGLTEWDQETPQERKGQGCVSVIILEREGDNEFTLKQKVLEIINTLKKRNYNYRDIGILALKNETVMDVSMWLNEAEIPFISFSSLDIRKRRVTAEIISLLKFLESPMDDLSFAEFILGDICKAAFKNTISSFDWTEKARDFIFRHRIMEKNTQQHIPLYKHFEKEFPDLWNNYFSDLFRLSGYLPLYDLVTFIFNKFNVFKKHPGEEATFSRILKVINIIEGEGNNGIRDFIRIAEGEGEDESIWEISIPRDIDAVQVMTVHKAKGLEFPVVLMIFDYSTGYRDTFIIEKEEHIELLKLTKKLSEKSEYLASLYEKKERDDTTDILNRLYVAFTRAKDELYIIGWRSSSDKKSKEDILSLISVDEFCGSELARGPVEPKILEEKRGVVLVHRAGSLETHLSSHIVNISDTERGEFIHRILSSIRYISDDSEEEIINKICKMNKEFGDVYNSEEIKKIISNTIHHPELRDYFIYKPERVIKNEHEFSDKYGRLYRMDRIVFDKECITVIEYKTGDITHENEYIDQLKNYMLILRDIYPEYFVKGCIFYVDLNKTKWIE